MAYQRKTRDTWEVQGWYDGWECVTGAETFREARGYLKDYRENERGTSFRIRMVREPIEPVNSAQFIEDTFNAQLRAIVQEDNVQDG